MKAPLMSAKNYLKTDYKLHVSRVEPCALSTSQPEYLGQCEHKHNVSCDCCEELRNVLVDLQLSLSSSAVKYSDADQQEGIEHDMNTSASKLDEWKAHILRAAH
ncbi:PREDICTED: uncharacterized protein LOC107344486 [Acropora digitifera]|uniref:uncharacterized protein LOC107344486 n=1 Tax=Acropora digitifera TaxID=70779 RepID=UPI00077A56D4|nr:PREDICTED: uncharacterized protein LOC107344486 [Acropora digitifera]